MEPLEEVVQLDPAGWWQSGDYVTIKAEMTTADEEWIQNQVVRLYPDLASGTPSRAGSSQVVMESRLGSVKRLTLERMIVAGRIHKRSGAVLDFMTPEQRAQNVPRLASYDSDYIYQEINRRNQPPSGEEQQRFFASAAAPSLESPDSSQN